MSKFTDNVVKLEELGYEVSSEPYIKNGLLIIFDPSIFNPTRLDTKIIIKREGVEITIYGEKEFNRFCYDVLLQEDRFKEGANKMLRYKKEIEKLKESNFNLETKTDLYALRSESLEDENNEYYDKIVKLEEQIKIHKENELYLDTEWLKERNLREAEFQKNKKEYEELADKYLKLKEELMRANQLNIKLMQEKFSI